LIVNALDAMPNGGKLKISCKRIAETAILSFSDEGEGISEELRERIFEPFFSTKGLNGTGLGLSVSYGIVEKHDGKISVASNVGEGATFIIELPLQIVSPDSSVKSQNQLPARKLSVLVVDDEDFVREALSEMISELSHDVKSATSVKSALQVMETQRFDIVFTDLSMPEMDGWDLAREINLRWAQTKTVLVTGYGKVLQVTPEQQKLITAVLAKPFNFEQLTNVLEKAGEN
ncbi:MAG: response regulator, partial [Pyrinomonadaceae bacterium]|nr:response regulator [Pyrinomonadaceae bacterium]